MRLIRALSVLSILLACAACGRGEGLPAAQAAEGPLESIVLGMGCFWGAEKRMAAVPGVVDVESGYANGEVAARYRSIIQHEKALREGRSARRNHAEVVRVRFDPRHTDIDSVLIAFWENHDPTQGDRQGNDVGSNYRSAIYHESEAHHAAALRTRARYQQALDAAGFGTITTEIAPLTRYAAAEDHHQDYLVKNSDGYCGLGGTGVAYPSRDGTAADRSATVATADPATLDRSRQLLVFEAEECPYCRLFRSEIMDGWSAQVAIAATMATQPPAGWELAKPLFATPTIVLFEQGRETARYTGYNGEAERFWKWLGFRLLTPAQQKIAFEQGTEYAYSGSHLDETRPGYYVDPISGARLFRSDAKFDSGTGWPSFFQPEEGAVTLHTDNSHGMRRVEVRSASSGIHLGHVFDDGPPPSRQRYCINGNVLRFVPDPQPDML